MDAVSQNGAVADLSLPGDTPGDTPGQEASDPYLQRMWKLRYFLLSLVGMDLRARYKRSILGVGWSLVRPIAMTVVLCVVFCQLFGQGVRDYAPFLLCGL